MAIADVVTVVRASTASYFDSSGIMRTAAENVWRQDHDPITAAPLGVLIEEARTNLLIGSTNFVGWLLTGATMATDTVRAPNASLAYKLTEDGSLGSHRNRTASVTVAAGSVHTVSVYGRAAERRYLQIATSTGTNGIGSGFVNFDLQTGTMAVTPGTSSLSASITQSRSGWYYCRATFATAGTDPTITGQVFFCTADSLSYGRLGSHQGVSGEGLHIFGPQMELGAFPTSYIPTTTAAVTRASDVLSLAPSPWYRPSQGTLVFDYFQRAETRLTDGGGASLFQIAGSSSDAGRLGLLYSSTPNIQLVKSASVETNSASNGGQKFAISWQGATTSMAVDGTLRITDANMPVTTLPGDAFLSLGRRYPSINNRVLNGHIRSVVYYPDRVPNSQLQAMSV